MVGTKRRTRLIAVLAIAMLVVAACGGDDDDDGGGATGTTGGGESFRVAMLLPGTPTLRREQEEALAGQPPADPTAARPVDEAVERRDQREFADDHTRQQGDISS